MNRSRNLAILALLLVGASTRVTAGQGDNLIYVPVAPCRIVNTLASAGGNLVPGVPQDFRAYGADLSLQGGTDAAAGGCEHPKSAEGLAPAAISVNLAAVGALASGTGGNIVAYPSGSPKPTAATINFVKGTNISNATIITLCKGDACPGPEHFTLESASSTVPAVVDVQGYFYPKELNNVVTVSAAGGDFGTGEEVMAYLQGLIDDDDPNKPGPDNPYVVVFGPGHYSLAQPMQLHGGVTYRGAGQDMTVLAGTVLGVDGATLRNLTVAPMGMGGDVIALENRNGSPTVEAVTLRPEGGTHNIGVLNDAASPTLTDVTIEVLDAGTENTGVSNENGSAPQMRNVNVDARNATANWAVSNFDGSTPSCAHCALVGGFHNDASSSASLAVGTLDGPVTPGGGMTCAYVADGNLTPLDGNCLPPPL